MDEVPPFVHKEVVCRSGLWNVEEFQALLVREKKNLKKDYTNILIQN